MSSNNLTRSILLAIFIAIPFCGENKRLQNNATGQPIADQQIPVLCYHQVREWTAKDKSTARHYIIPPAQFQHHMRMLHDSGYHTILPDQLIEYITHGKSLPSRPIMITFDDGPASQFITALPVLDNYSFKSVFFIMTVTIDRPGYMTSKQIKYLSDNGHIIGCHTWDHHDVRKYAESDWTIQLRKPTRLLEELTGKTVKYFAYPFGVWDKPAIDQLKNEKYIAAFQLSAGQDENEPLYTIRRIIADGNWNIKELNTAIKRSFKQQVH